MHINRRRYMINISWGNSPAVFYYPHFTVFSCFTTSAYIFSLFFTLSLWFPSKDYGSFLLRILAAGRARSLSKVVQIRANERYFKEPLDNITVSCTNNVRYHTAYSTRVLVYKQGKIHEILSFETATR